MKNIYQERSRFLDVNNVVPYSFSQKTECEKRELTKLDENITSIDGPPLDFDQEVKHSYKDTKWKQVSQLVLNPTKYVVLKYIKSYESIEVSPNFIYLYSLHSSHSYPNL